MYLRSLVLVIDFGWPSDPSISLTLLVTQSQPLRWSIDPLVARAKTKVFCLGMLSGRVFMSTSIADFVSGVSRIGTFLFLLPVISIRSNLKI